jgi:hypothetical protein
MILTPISEKKRERLQILTSRKRFAIYAKGYLTKGGMKAWISETVHKTQIC